MDFPNFNTNVLRLSHFLQEDLLHCQLLFLAISFYQKVPLSISLTFSNLNYLTLLYKMKKLHFNSKNNNIFFYYYYFFKLFKHFVN